MNQVCNRIKWHNVCKMLSKEPGTWQKSLHISVFSLVHFSLKISNLQYDDDSLNLHGVLELSGHMLALSGTSVAPSPVQTGVEVPYCSVRGLHLQQWLLPKPMDVNTAAIQSPLLDPVRCKPGTDF